MRKLLIALCLATPALADDPVVDFESGDAAMNAAIEAAQATFPHFWATNVDADGFADEGASIKVAVPYEDGREHIWMGPCRGDLTNDVFVCVVANDPVHVDLEPGRLFPFERHMISDWMKRDADGMIEGGYTLRAMLPRLPEDQAEALRAQLLPLVEE